MERVGGSRQATSYMPSRMARPATYLTAKRSPSSMVPRSALCCLPHARDPHRATRRACATAPRHCALRPYPAERMATEDNRMAWACGWRQLSQSYSYRQRERVAGREVWACGPKRGEGTWRM